MVIADTILHKTCAEMRAKTNLGSRTTGKMAEKIQANPIGNGPAPPFRTARRGQSELASPAPDLPLVYFIGDSHVSVFAGVDAIVPGFPAIADSTYPNVRVCKLGPTLAATMNKENSTQAGRKKAFAVLQSVESGAIVFLSFGEIDCRVHIPRRAGFAASGIELAVISAMENFFGFVEEFRAEAATKNINIGLLSPPPTASFDSEGSQGKLFRMLRRSNSSRTARVLYRILKNFIPRRQRLLLNNAQHPTYADDWALRNQALGLMRDKMRTYSEISDLSFVDMFEPFLEPDGRSADRWFMDNIHLSVRAIPEVASQFEACGVPNFLIDAK